MLGKMDCFGMTDTGRVRPANEDQFLIANLSKSLQIVGTSLDLEDQSRLYGPSQGRLMLVADGMGGHAAGRRASALAVDSLATYVLSTLHWFFRLREDQVENFADDLKAALTFCQEQLKAEAARVPEERGMGTTLTMAYLVWPRLFVVHAGDSRCYLLRGGRLRRLTRDHTIAQQLAALVDKVGVDNLLNRRQCWPLPPMHDKSVHSVWRRPVSWQSARRRALILSPLADVFLYLFANRLQQLTH